MKIKKFFRRILSNSTIEKVKKIKKKVEKFFFLIFLFFCALKLTKWILRKITFLKKCLILILISVEKLEQTCNNKK